MTLNKLASCIRVSFRGGKGGNGCISMLSIFANEFAGPDGGNGGNGGHVVLKANDKIKSLDKVKASYRASEGITGRGKNKYGHNGKHLFIDVPVGTIVSKPKDLKEKDSTQSDVVAHLDEHGCLFIAARGGAGGRGNASYLTNSNRHPRIAEAGAKGEFNIYFLRVGTLDDSIQIDR